MKSELASNQILFVSDYEADDSSGLCRIKPEEFQPSLLKNYRGVVMMSSPWYRSMVKSIRQHPDINVYLKPVFVRNESRVEIMEYGKMALDGIIEGISNERFINENSALINEIDKRIESFASAPSTQAPGEYGLAIKAIRYVHTRGVGIRPIRFTKSTFGYSYPVIDVLVGQNHYQQFSLVDFLENRALIEGTFVDRIHACAFCYSSFLNFREICVNCQSPNISNEDLVHHFPCGNIGPESDYDRLGEMVCPKCRKALRHIGVDFDRPSQVFNCNSCNHDFQEPQVDAICLNCGKVIPTEKLLFRTLKEFSLTPLGEASAHSGIVYSLKEEFGSDIDVITMEAFNIALNLEIERIKRYKKTLSTAVKFKFGNFPELLNVLGSESITFFHQIGKEISDFLRSTDLVTFMDDRTLLFLLTETNAENAKIALNRLKGRISNYAKSAVNIPLVMENSNIELDGAKPAIEIIQELRQNV